MIVESRTLHVFAGSKVFPKRFNYDVLPSDYNIVKQIINKYRNEIYDSFVINNIFNEILNNDDKSLRGYAHIDSHIM